jgi:hypothetical protein
MFSYQLERRTGKKVIIPGEQKNEEGARATNAELPRDFQANLSFLSTANGRH